MAIRNPNTLARAKPWTIANGAVAELASWATNCTSFG